MTQSCPSMGTYDSELPYAVPLLDGDPARWAGGAGAAPG